MKITKEQAEIMLKKMPEMANEIYLDYPELKPLKVADSWEQLNEISGYYIIANSCISFAGSCLKPVVDNKNVFKTKKQAASVLAYAQLTQLMADCGDCEIDWENENTKQCVVYSGTQIDVFNYRGTFQFLAFNTLEIAKEFMKKHEGLIKTFYQL